MNCFYNLNCSMENNNEIDEGNARFSRSNFRQIETNLFAPYKALGLICSSVPPAFMLSPPKSGKDGYICCALDNQITGFTVSPLRLAFGMAPLESEITLLAADTHRIYAAFSNFVAVIKNRKLEYRLPIPNGGAKLLLSLTESIVIVDKGNGMNVFNVRDGQPIVQLDSPASFQITALVHPHTYLNKILVGAADGRMRLWNLRSGKLVHEFPADEDFCSAIRVLEQSTAIDVVGAGMEDGQIHLRNIKVDKILCTFRQTGKITALAFRTDGVDTLASVNSEGTIAIWDLNGRQLLCQLPEAHKASSITFLHFLLGQPMMLSAGGDNKIVKWFCRNENSAPEVNNILEGHSEPATSLKFCDDLIISTSQDGHVRQFLTKRTHRVKDFGLAREVRRGNLSKDRFIDVPLGPITQMEMSRGMEAVWDNLICSHEESPLISTWSTRYMRRGAHLLYHDRFANRPELLTAFVSALSVSNCGNFALAGYSSGHVDVFNMQSGNYKFSLENRWTTAMALKEPQQSTRKKKKSDGRAHESLVSGIALDLLNRNAVTGAADGKIHFWEFGQSPKLRTKMRVNSGVRLFRLDLFNSLLAVGLESGEVGVVDILCRRLARQLAHYNYIDWTEQAHLTALEFSGDGKWLLSADNQGFIKVWSLASGMLIDVMHCLRPCIGMAFSERSDFLATLHDGQRGIYLWANKRLFMTESPIVSRTVDELHQNAAAPIPLPNFVQQLNELQNKQIDNDKEGELEESVHSERIVRIDEDEDDDDEKPSSCRGDAEMMDLEKESAEAGPSSASMHSSFTAEREQLDCRLFTLSGLAPSRWAGLPILDQIRQRNRPKEPPKKAKAAPFFLPTMDTPEGFQFDRGAMEKLREEGNNGNGGRPIAMAIRRLGPGETLQEKWQNALMRAKSKAEHCELFAQLKEMSLSALDFQIRSLNGSSELAQFLAMLAAISETRREFDLVQSYLATFLNIHHERLWNGEERKREEGMEEEGEQNEDEQKALTENLERVLAFQKQTMEEIQPLFDRALHLAEFTKSALI